jgi:hypothetical protein
MSTPAGKNVEKTQFDAQLMNSPSRAFGKGLDFQPGQLLDQFVRGVFGGTWNSEGIPSKFSFELLC